jgi:hypothetical protein
LIVSDSPSANGGDGRNARGQFTAGNKHARGNPLAGAVTKLRSSMLRAVTQDDLDDIVAEVVRQGKAGNLAAIKLLLAYTVGKPIDYSAMDRLENEHERAQKTRDFMAGHISIDELI